MTGLDEDVLDATLGIDDGAGWIEAVGLGVKPAKAGEQTAFAASGVTHPSRRWDHGRGAG